MRDFVADCLATGEHPHVVLACETAQAWGKPPAMLLGGPSEWSDRDSIMALGYQLYQRSLCSECGQPVSVCQNPASDGWYEVEERTCYAKKAISEHTSTPGYSPEPGGMLYPVRTQPQGTEKGGHGARPW